jgi:divalent metal cation (Fe/Co/Zn/Cd) transporter
MTDSAEKRVGQNQEKLYSTANLLALITILYNLLEGLVSMWLGAADETLALFGFGVDSFIEVCSAVGVWHMVRRIMANGGATRDEFEKRALRITGVSFYLLAIGLALTAAIDLVQRHKPETTFWGIVVSLVSISCMWLLIHYKTKVGKALGSAAILADAACSRACVYLSVVLLVSSLGYELTGIGSLDAVGALLIAWFAWKEGREALGKAKGLSCAGKCSCNG